MGQLLCKSESFDSPIIVPDIASSGAVEEYDLIIIGGGSGGLAAAKEAAQFNKKILVCDYVVPSPLGTTWGLGGTCTNVGCIPKKLMHFAALNGQILHNVEFYGYKNHKRPDDNKISTTINRAGFDWPTLVNEIQNHIHSLNFKNKVTLRENKVTYLNKFVEFVDSYTLEVVNSMKERKFVKGQHIIVAGGGRPRYLDVPGGRKEDKLCISSDDIFSLESHPGKVLIIGAGYIALETAGLLHGLGVDVTIMVRSLILRGHDQEMANRIREHMTWIGIPFLMETEPVEFKRIDEKTIQVDSKNQAGELITGKYNTVMLAVGRDPCTLELSVKNAGIKLNSKNQRILVNAADQTNIRHIYAIGDIADGHMELTPVATHSAKRLVRRLYGGSKVLTDYINVPTTIFTPIEYGSIGLSEEDAITKYGPTNTIVYQKSFMPLQYILPHQDPNSCFAKLICIKSLKERVVGLHYFGPDAAEIVQGFQLGFHLKAKKSDFDNLSGVHPSCGELFSVLRITKGAGQVDDTQDC